MKEEFVINSPTTSSIKFWPVALGYSTTHAIIMARLIIKAKDHGVHPFMAQLRSLDDFKPFPGIDLGDIGPKYGFNQVDNGYLRFENYRIPRTNLLMAHASVSPDGSYVGPEHPKIFYSGMSSYGANW